MQQEVNPGMDIIPNMDLGEDEQLQSQSLGDTEILEEQLHIEKDTTTTLQSQQYEEEEGQGSVTQEPVALHPLVKVVAKNNVDKEIKIQEEFVTQEPTPSRSALEVAIGELQREDAVTQEPTSPEVVSETPMVEVAVGEIQGRDAVTQEPPPPKVISEE